MRPPGYEPGELPTAPLRDINISFSFAPHFWFAIAKVLLFFEYAKFSDIFLIKIHKMTEKVAFFAVWYSLFTSV